MIVFLVLALLRPLDHDESQYVAATALAARGWLPYRDFAYLQTPLQPLLFAPVAALAGIWTWPALRVANALLGAAAVTGVWRAASEAGGGGSAALAAAGLFAMCDVLLFSSGTARNDALPAAMLAWALVPALRGTVGGATRGSAALAGLLFAGAAAAKLSYALPAAAYGIQAMIDRRQRPFWVALGAAPMLALVAVLASVSAPQFWFEVFRFPVEGPAEYYVSQGRAWSLSWLGRAVDSLKFLALGPAPVAVWAIVRDWTRTPAGLLLISLAFAGALAAILPAPTWRQYWLPALVPLFVRLALAWQTNPPDRIARIAAIAFACAGLAPSVWALSRATQGVPLVEALRDGGSMRAAFDRGAIGDGIATLSPQFVPATGRAPDRSFATGPFYFRSRGLLSPQQEQRFNLISQDRLDAVWAASTARAPRAILVGGENDWTNGNATLDAKLEHWAVAHHYRAVPVAGSRFRLYVMPR
ncbi:MAG: DUF2029 domain-containing protein [Sphingomonas sp.]